MGHFFSSKVREIWFCWLYKSAEKWEYSTRQDNHTEKARKDPLNEENVDLSQGRRLGKFQILVPRGFLRLVL